MLETLRTFFIESDVQEIDAMQDPAHTCLSRPMYATAQKFAAEYMLGQWVRTQNLTTGMALRTASLIQEFNGRVEAASLDTMLQRIPGIESSTGRSWACRWRTKQRARFGPMRTRQPLTTDDKREKVSCQCYKQHKC